MSRANQRNQLLGIPAPPAPLAGWRH